MLPSDYFFKLFDKIIEHINYYDRFELAEVANKIPESLGEGTANHETFKNFMVKEVKYLEKDDVTEVGYWFKLSEIGREVKKAGGHFNYQKQLKDEKEKDRLRKEVDDALKKAQIKNLNFANTKERITKYATIVAIVFTLLFTILNFFRGCK